MKITLPKWLTEGWPVLSAIVFFIFALGKFYDMVISGFKTTGDQYVSLKVDMADVKKTTDDVQEKINTMNETLAADHAVIKILAQRNFGATTYVPPAIP